MGRLAGAVLPPHQPGVPLSFLASSASQLAAAETGGAFFANFLATNWVEFQPAGTDWLLPIWRSLFRFSFLQFPLAFPHPIHSMMEQIVQKMEEFGVKSRGKPPPTKNETTFSPKMNPTNRRECVACSINFDFYMFLISIAASRPNNPRKKK